MKINKNKFFLQPLKTIAVVGFSFFIVWGYAKTALNLSCLNPISERETGKGKSVSYSSRFCFFA